jgi:hypothetical protein
LPRPRGLTRPKGLIDLFPFPLGALGVYFCDGRADAPELHSLLVSGNFVCPADMFDNALDALCATVRLHPLGKPEREGVLDVDPETEICSPEALREPPGYDHRDT